jgi:hypothetical protein
MAKDARKRPANQLLQQLKYVNPSLLYTKRAQTAIEQLAVPRFSESYYFFWQSFFIKEDEISDVEERACVQMARKSFYGAMGHLAVFLAEKISEPTEALEVLEHIDTIVNNTRFLAHCEDDVFKLEFKLRLKAVADAKRMREQRAKKIGPNIMRRRSLLEAAGYNLDDLGKSRKCAEAIAADFAAKCEAEGVDRVSGKQIQRDARDILKARHEKPGHS